MDVARADCRLFVLSSGHDGTILVATNDRVLPFRVAVRDIPRDWNISEPSDGFKSNSFLNIPCSTPSINAVMSEDFSYAPTRLLSVHNTPPLNMRSKHLPSETRNRKDRPQKLSSLRTENAQPQHYYATAGTYSIPTIPTLLSFTYFGSLNVNIGDTLEWKFSILEGDAPVARISFDLCGPFASRRTVSKHLNTPAGFGQGEPIVTNGTISITLTESMFLDGTYFCCNFQLITQDCPLPIKVLIDGAVYLSLGWQSTGYFNIEGIGFSLEGSTSLASVRGLSSIVVGDGIPPVLTPPILTYLANTTRLNAMPGDRLEWAYSVVQGSFPLRSVTLNFNGPGSFGPLSFVASRGAGGAADQEPGSLVSGTVSIDVNSSWLAGKYSGFYLLLSSAASPFPLVNTYMSNGYSYSVPNIPGYSSPPLSPDVHLGALSFTVGAGEPPAVFLPVLAEFSYAGPATLYDGDAMVWNYAIRRGSGRVLLLAVSVKRCPPPAPGSRFSMCAYKTFEFQVPAPGPGAMEGALVRGTVSVAARSKPLPPPPPFPGAYVPGPFPENVRPAGMMSPMMQGDYAYDYVSVVGEAAPGSSRTMTTTYILQESAYIYTQPNGLPLAGDAPSSMIPPDLAANLSGAVVFTYASPAMCEFLPVPVPPRKGRVAVPTAVGDGPCENSALHWQVM
jgi:hypothetical protein